MNTYRTQYITSVDLSVQVSDHRGTPLRGALRTFRGLSLEHALLDLLNYAKEHPELFPEGIIDVIQLVNGAVEVSLAKHQLCKACKLQASVDDWVPSLGEASDPVVIPTKFKSRLLPKRKLPLPKKKLPKLRLKKKPCARD